MQPERALPIYGSPTAGQLQIVRDAKTSLGVDFYVKPAVATAESHGERVLAWGTPDFACEWANVAQADTVERMAPAVAWALGLREDPRIGTVASWLSRMMNGQVREITPQQLAKEKRDSMPLSQRLKLDIK